MFLGKKNMDVEILTNSEAQFKCIARDIEPTFMNALRRIIMAEVPIPAIEKVYIVENTGVLYDDILAHRLGLVPLKGGEALTMVEKCSCGGKGCSQCESVLTLEIEAKEDNSMVYSGRLKSEGPVFPANNNVPIAELNAGQKLTLQAHARLGIGKDHAKWQPVSAAALKFEPKIEIDESKCNQCANCVKECPRKVLSIKDKKIIVTSLWDCTLCKVCEEICPESAINISYNDRNSMLIIETTGSISNDALVLTGCDVLLQKIENLKNWMKELPEVT
jgi:DNA-directed RNA polymerase subunit D